jgi:uncharacterized protein with FMN-binding domain
MRRKYKVKLPRKVKANRFPLAIAIFFGGTVLAALHPEWGKSAGAAVLLLAGAIAAAVLTIRLRSEDYLGRRRGAGQKISNGLITLSSAAILAVYVAGYYRTSSAEDKFDEQSARRKAAEPITASAAGPEEVTPKVQAPPGLPPAPRNQAAPKVPPALAPSFSPDPTQSSPARVQSAMPAPRAAEDSPSTPSFAPPPPPAPPEPERPPLPAITTRPPFAEPAPPPPPPPAKAQSRYKDGTYYGYGTSRHGDIEASVVIQAGQIASTEISRCLTRYSCSWIAELPGQVVKRQSPKIDFVSGATQSCDAFYQAVVEALSKASE